MRVLSISYKGKEISRYRVSSPLILVGRSPLCDILLRTPGVKSVHFIFEWIGEGQFKPENAYKDEWVMTEVGENESVISEKKANKSVVGQGAIFHERPIRADEFVFSWIEDRLVEADLSRKILSLQLEELKELSVPNQTKSNAAVLEVITINSDVDSVSAIQHFSFLKLSDWNTPMLSQFSGTPKINNSIRTVQFKIPSDAKKQIIRQSDNSGETVGETVEIGLHDVLHVQWHTQEYYFRVVPKVFVPTIRRSIWSDPFYLISSFCILIAAFGFFLIFKNVKNEKQTFVAPPRIAQIQLVEVVKPTPLALPTEVDQQPILEVKPIEQEQDKMLEVPPADPKKETEMSKQDSKSQSQDNKRETVKLPSAVQAQAKNSEVLKGAPKVVDKNKGSLDNEAPKASVNRTGFLGAIRANKNVGMVKADQVIDKGIVSDSVKGKSGNFVLEQTPSGIVNNKFQKEGESLSAAATKVNVGDAVGSGSFNVKKGDVLKEGFKADYNVSRESGLLDGTFGGMLEAQVEGGLDKASVQSAIRAFKSEIRTCYEKALRVKSGVGGRVVYKFQIKPDGSVLWINVHKSDVDSGTLVSCVQTVVKGIEFPKAKNGQYTTVIYPFQFNKKGG